MKTFVEFLKPVRKRLRELTDQPDQLTLVFDAGASSRQNLEGLERYVTAVRPSDHRALLSEAGGHLAEVPWSNGAIVRAWRTQRTIAGKQREVVVVFSPQLHAGQLRGLQQTLSRSWRELEEMRLHPPKSVEAAKRKLDKIRRHQYLGSLLCYEVTRDGKGPLRIRVWSDWQEYQRLITSYFGLRILITDRAEWSTAQIIQAYRGQSKVEAAFRSRVSRFKRSSHAFHSTAVSLDRPEIARSRFPVCDGLFARHAAAPARETEGRLRRRSPPALGGVGRNPLLPPGRYYRPKGATARALADRRV